MLMTNLVGSSRRAWRLMPLLLCLAATVLFTASAAMARTDAHRMGYHYVDSSSAEPGDFECPIRDDAVDTMPVISSFPIGSEPGDNWLGSARVEVCIYVMPDDTMEYVGTETDTTTTTPCGSGTIDYVVEGRLAAPDADGVRVDRGTWRIVPGSGTGELAAVKKGSGSYSGTVDVDFVSTGYLSGTVHC